MAIELIIFDLDGVLLNSRHVVETAVRRGIDDLAGETGRTFSLPSREEIYALMGRPNATWLEGLDLSLSAPEWAFFKERVAGEEIQAIRRGEGLVYAGIEDILIWLMNRNQRCAIASNCGREYLLAFLDHFRLDAYFDFSLCNDDAPPDGDKTDLLGMVLENQQVYAAEAVYIGDRGADETAAGNLGLGFIGCLWGFGAPDEFSDRAVCCEQPVDLHDVLRKLLAIGRE
ncbi:MAG: HAD family hydrolase [Acidobacteria bacterium]|nr:HAD family hydrolase [Acidobacteriota bacterium]